MAWDNVKNEPKREWIEQGFGVLFFIAYSAWCVYSVHLSTLIYDPSGCIPYTDGTCRGWVTGYWTDPGDFFITLGLIIAPWLLYPLWYIVHELGEFACALLTGMGWDPRPNPRENTYIRRR